MADSSLKTKDGKKDKTKGKKSSKKGSKGQRTKTAQGKEGGVQAAKKPLYKRGDDVGGHVVDTILGQNAAMRVYFTEDDQLRWEHDSESGDTQQLMDALHIFDSLMPRVKRYVPKSDRQDVFFQLGKALFTAVSIQDRDKIAGIFQPTQTFINRKAAEKARAAYLVAGLVAIFPVLLLIFLIGSGFTDVPQVERYQWAAVLGVVGAMVSMLQRGSNLNLDPFAPGGYAAIQAPSKIVIGAVFGVVMVMGIEADLIVSVAKDSQATVMLFAFAAGFSERLIPEFLQRIEDSQSDQSQPLAKKSK